VVVVVNWNPRRRLGRGRFTVQVPFTPRVNNFGDLLGPLIVQRMRERRGLGAPVDPARRLLTVGSIMHFAREGDVIWGTGVNGNVARARVTGGLSVRATRGPRAAGLLRQWGNRVPPVYGDPALLLPQLWDDRELGIVRRSSGVVYVPHWEDRGLFPSDALNPRGEAMEVVRAIASASLVVSSSLHGIIVAEAYGVPAVPVRASRESLLKYHDYYEGTGRTLPDFAPTPELAGSYEPAPAIVDWSPQPLLDAFPDELWEAAAAAMPPRGD
jgi:pyruvyltransferase